MEVTVIVFAYTLRGESREWERWRKGLLDASEDMMIDADGIR